VSDPSEVQTAPGNQSVQAYASTLAPDLHNINLLGKRTVSAKETEEICALAGESQHTANEKDDQNDT